MPPHLIILAKIFLTYMPGARLLATKLGLFKWGQMASAAYAHKIFHLHIKESFGEEAAASPASVVSGKTLLELGPGDSLASALLAHAYGAKQIYLVDAGAFASASLADYQRMAADFTAMGVPNMPRFAGITTLPQLLQKLNAHYLTTGLQALQTIPANSVDHIWSHSVMEHVRLRDFVPTLQQLARVLVPVTGRMSHNIDLKDHLAQGLNNLRFSEKLWEANWFARCGFYTNRLRASQIISAVQQAGLHIVLQRGGRWATLPTPRTKLAAPFNSMSDDDLLTPTLSVVAQKA